MLRFVGNMNWFDAICHTFTTMATGGFSTQSASIGAFNSAAVDWIITFFMFLAGINFSLHYRALTGKPGAYWRDANFVFMRFFCLL